MKNALAVTLMNMGKLPEAISRLWQALSLDPGNFRTRINLGIAFGRSGKHLEAAEQFKEVIRVRPDLVEPRWNLVAACEAMGRSAEAMVAAERARAVARSTGQIDDLQKIEAWLRFHRASMVTMPAR